MTLHEVQMECNYHLEKIAKCFNPGVKLTLIARLPGNDRADFVLSGDDLEEAAGVLERRTDNQVLSK
jgi:hypothetical protein